MRTKFKNCGPSAESAKFWCVENFNVYGISSAVMWAASLSWKSRGSNTLDSLGTS